MSGPGPGLDRSLRPVLAPATLGMLGGGQLGRYFVHAAHELGYRVWVLDPDPASPAGLIADRHLCAAYDDRASLDAMASGCAAVSTEFENVPADSLTHLAGSTLVRPRAAAVAICQDRITEKDFLRANDLPVGPLAVIRQQADLQGVDQGLFPAILKRARFGYDGKGQMAVANHQEAADAFLELGQVDCVLEKRLPLDRELSVVLARGVTGEITCFPVAENQHRNGILDVTITPARIEPSEAVVAETLAIRVAEALDFVGTLAVEMFISHGQLLINEIAPRPHNSGHVTLDSTVASQFEQQVRAVCGLPLASARPVSPAVMVNLLGDLWPNQGHEEPAWPLLLERAELKVHLYGKTAARAGRKMGHFTVLGTNLEEALSNAMAARAAIGIEG